MKYIPLYYLLRSAVIVPSLCAMVWAQQPEPIASSQSLTTQAKSPIEVLKFKIGSDYYPLLDRKGSMMTADNPDYPRLDGEWQARRSGRRGDFSTQVETTKARGKLRSNVRLISDAQWVNVTVKNTTSKAIKAVDWDFAFLRHEAGKPAFRYDVASQVEIKPGGKKTLKQPLPPGAKRCQAIIVNANSQDGAAQTFEAVCGPGFMVPSQTGQETVSIKRIEYSDGSVWQRL